MTSEEIRKEYPYGTTRNANGAIELTKLEVLEQIAASLRCIAENQRGISNTLVEIRYLIPRR